ncbi:MAG: flagellar hook protein FlgE [Desulfomicrobiaceae bacterium]|nr:flagellar hook protein FlgE [Desulfomicrobiaceae bacterium]
MGLSASMYAGTSGLRVHGEDMSVIGNNISNISTIGFKASRSYFEDTLSQTISVANGVGQVGRGVAMGAVMGDFSQGSLETTNEATDLAIGGNGFFVVVPPGEETNYYTRAGSFRFDKDGYLVDPHGYRLQGWAIQSDDTSEVVSTTETSAPSATVKIVGVPTDIKLENFQSPPQATSRVDLILNLDSRAVDRSVEDGDPPATTPFDGTPFTAMFDAYDANSVDGVPLGDARYAYQTTIKVYDENGGAHNLTVYMDPINDPDVTDNAGGKRYWEYIVAVPPNEDNREFWAVQTDTSKRGILMAGTLTFNATGELEGMSAFTINNPYNGTGGTEPTPGPPPTAGTFATDASAITNWTPANFSKNGFPVCTANFLGKANGSITATDDSAATPNIPPKDLTLTDNSPANIEINFGLRNKATNWSGGLANLDELRRLMQTGNSGGAVTTSAEMQAALATINNFASVEANALRTTSYSSASTTVYQSQNGYAAGFLQSISVDRDGVLTGRYSNGQVQQLYALTLATFNNNYGLYREGGNLFTETRASGPAITGLANTGGKGSIASNALEQSNVDLATEFVKMITTEKGFQANSKTITTTENLMNTLIQLKR